MSHRGYDYGRSGYDGRRGGGYGRDQSRHDRNPPPRYYDDDRLHPSSSSRHHSGGRGRSRSAPPPRRRLDDQDYEVQTNYFKIKAAKEGQGQEGSCIEYRATIYVARKLTRGPNGEALEIPQYTFRERRVDNGFIPGSKIELSMEIGATQKTEDIFLALHKALMNQIPSQCIVTDGGRTVFAAKRLVMGKDSPIKDNAATTEVVMDKKNESEKAAVNDPTPSIMFPVTIKKGCRQNDDDKDFAESLPNAHFIVGLEEIGPLYYSRSGDSVWPRNDAEVEKFAQFLNILTRTTMLAAGCRSFISKSRSCFFPRATQERLVADEPSAQTSKANKRDTDKPEETLMLGLNQSARACMNRQMYVARNTTMTWFQLDKTRIPNSEEYSRVPVLDPTRGTIAGIRVGELNRPVPLNRRKEIEAALDKLVFHVMFKTRPTEERERDARARAAELKGVRSEEEITEYVNKRLFQDLVRPEEWMRQADTEHKPLVLWAADDETSEFDYKGSKVNVATYMQRRYGVTLRYPKMPLVQTRLGYYPVEFLFQALAPLKGANDDRHKDAVLRYHDNNAGDKKMGHIQRVVGEIHSGTEIESMFGLAISREPVVQPAKLLAEPRLEFGGNQSQEVSNGSWNLVNRGLLRFKRPADFSSFCVVDFAGDRQHELVSGLLDQCAKHGLENVHYKKEYREVTKAVTFRAGALRGANMVQQIYDGVQHAIELAKDFFLRDRSFFFVRRRIMFETTIVHPRGGPTKCLVYPDESGELNAVYPENVMPATHIVRVGGAVHQARMFVVVKTEDGEEFSVDPFDFRWNSVLSPSDNEASGLHWVARRRQDVWEAVSFRRFEWRLIHDRNTVVDSSAVLGCAQCDSTWVVECPSIVFVILQRKEKEPYQLVKLVTNFYCGVQSQCLVWDTYTRQKRGGPEQYWSSIALKLNTKLSNVMNKAQAWSIGDYRRSIGMPWISDETMIVGIAMSRGSGRDSKTVAAATVALVDASGSCMSNGFSVKVQSSPDVVDPKVMRSLFKALTLHISEHTKKFPKQVLVFRDGSSEGNFPALQEVEITNVSQGLKNAWDEKNKAASPPPKFEPPKLTYVVCVNQHNVQVCPSRGNGVGRQVKNVPSGCCVNDIIMPFHDMQIGNDFLLTSQGGLKGTSKAVFFRTLLNENPTLSRDILQAVVFGLAFNYGTATKATRRLSVTQYSKRLAEQFLAYLPYIDGRKHSIDGMPTVFVHPLGEEEASRVDPRKKQGADDSTSSDLLPGFTVHSESGDWLAPTRPNLAS